MTRGHPVDNAPLDAPSLEEIRGGVWRGLIQFEIQLRGRPVGVIRLSVSDNRVSLFFHVTLLQISRGVALAAVGGNGGS
jgi:hypothetical protein